MAADQTLDNLVDRGAIQASDLFPVLPVGGAILQKASATELQAFFGPVVNINPIGVMIATYGAKGDGITDDSAAFQKAANAGGRVIIPPATFIINTAPTAGNNSVYWDIDVNARFGGAATTGATGFPRAASNSLLAAVGPFIQTVSGLKIDGGAGGGAALTVEALPPASPPGDIFVAGYFGAQGAGSYDLWAGNYLITSLPGATGIYQVDETDCNQLSTANSLVIGKAVNLDGVANGFAAFSALSGQPSTALWNYGILLQDCVVAENIITTSVQCCRQTNTVFNFATSFCVDAIGQFVNGGDMSIWARATDTSPTGYLLRCIRADGASNLLTIDVAGNLTSVATVQAANVIGTATVSGAILEATTEVAAPLLISSGDCDVTSNVNAGGWVRSGTKTVATLPSPATAGAGARLFVTDATATTFLSTVVGGGANFVPVVCTGAAWLIG